jgi:hypothetical protein
LIDVSDFDPTMLARMELLPSLTSRIADPEAQRQAIEVYFAAVDRVFGAELPACEHERVARPHEAAGTYVCVFHPDRLHCFMCFMGHAMFHEDVDASWRCSACRRSDDLESINVTTGPPDGRVTFTGSKTCPACGGRPTLD